jgi:hypothetical protein
MSTRMIVTAIVLGLALPSAALAQSGRQLPVPESKPQTETMKLFKAYGETKRYCCQWANGCVDGPADGSRVCREIGGTPFRDSFCSKIVAPPLPPNFVCVDP